MKTAFVCGVTALAGLLAGCSNKPPQCSDEDVVSLVKQVFQQAVEKEAASMSEERLARFQYTAKEVKLSLESMTAQSIDEKVRKTTCEATLRITVPPETVAAINPEGVQQLNRKFEPVGAQIVPNGITASVKYSAQPTENGKELQVYLQGHKFAVDLLHEVALLRFFDKPFPPEPAAKSSNSDTTAKSAEASPKPDGLPSATFLDSKLIVRAGIDDLRGVTVREFVDSLSRIKRPDGQEAALLGWRKTNSGHTLRAKVAATFDINFQWAEGENIALLKDATMDGESVPGLQFHMLVAGMPKVDSPGANASPATTSTPTPTSPPNPAPAMQKEASLLTTSSAPESTANAAKPRSPLCAAGEEAVFGCATGKKQIAVCAMGSLANGTTQMTYRIAPIGQAAEMTYPSSLVAAKDAFKRGSESYMGDKSMAFLSFDKADIRYVAYAANGKGLDKSGVVVEQDGKRIASLVCTSDFIDRLAELERSGIPLDSRRFVMP